MTRPKVRVIVDVHYDEEGNEFFRVEDVLTHEAPAVGHLVSGFFLRSDDVDEWLDEFRHRVTVVVDYRERG